MAITVIDRTSIIELVVGMFGAAPGASVLSDLVAAFEKGQTIKQIAANLATTNEFKSIFPTFLTNEEYATKVVDQLVGNEVVAAEKAAAVTTLTAMLNAGASRSSVFVDAIDAVDAITSTNTAWANAGAALDNKVAVAVYYSVDKQLSGASLSVLQNVVATTTSSAASVTAAKASVDGTSEAATGATFTFTTSIDSIAGGAGSDTINATNTAASAVLGGLDTVDGGAGNDTLNITDTAIAATAAFNLPTGLSVKNVETLNVVANGSLGDSAATAFDVSGMTGLTKFKGTSAGDGTKNHGVKAAATTDVELTVSAGTTTVNGGKTVSISGGTGATVNDAAGTNTGTTLSAVTLTAVNGNATVKGGALTTLTVGGVTSAARTYTVDNATASHALTVNAAGTGYDSTGAEQQTVVTDTVATSATVNTSAKSSLNLSGSTAVTSVTLSGAGALKFAPMGAAVTSINGSAATGNLTLGDLNAAAVTVKTGSGNDTLAVQATTKASVETGTGDDVVTLKSVLAAASTITLGAGNDKALFATGGSVAVSTSTVIDGGEGSDSVSAQLLTAGNAAQFKNFELINLDSTTGFDVSLLTGSTITGLTMSGTSTSAAYQNLTTSAGLTVDFVGNNSGFTNTLNFTGVTGTADAYTVTFNAAAASTAAGTADVRAGTIVAAGIEAFTIASGGTNHWNEIALNGANAQTLTITGASNLDVSFVTAFGTAGSTGLSSIDGSAATGKLSINVANTGISSTAGLTVKGGSAADTITATTTKVTMTGGAGADTFNVAAAVVGTATFAGAVITSITDAASGDKIVFANLGTEVFTTTKINVTTATALIGGTTNALDLAAAAANTGGTDGQITWFQYGSDTYIVQELGADATVIGTDDIVVKLTGLIDLSTATYNAAANTLTLA